MNIVEIEIRGKAFAVVDRWQDRGLLHGFGDSGWDIATGVQEASELLGGKQIQLLTQHHSKTIIHFHAPTSDAEWEALSSHPLSGDAWIADFREAGLRDVLLGIKTADCFPVLIATPKLPVVAALHCGWRGAEAGLLLDTLVLFGRLGVPAKSIEIAIGPGAQVGKYEIGEDVRDLLQRAHSMVDAMSLEPTGPVVESREGKIFGNIRELLVSQALFFGVRRDQIACSSSCTISDPRFFSYRRDRENPGRQLSFIGGGSTAV